MENSEQDYSYIDDAPIENPEAFRIDSLPKCAWYINKLNSKREELERVKQNSVEIVQYLTNNLKRFEDRFKHEFTQEVRKHIPEGKKSLQTVFGKVQFRTLKPKIEILDAELVPKTFYKEKIDLVIDKEALKEAAFNGEVIEGVEVLPEREEVYVN